MTLQELMDRNYEQGLEQGRAEGATDTTLKLARAMKSEGIDSQVIARMTDLASEKIEEL